MDKQQIMPCCQKCPNRTISGEYCYNGQPCELCPKWCTPDSPDDTPQDVHGEECPNCKSTETVYSSLQTCYKCQDCACWFDGSGILEQD